MIRMLKNFKCKRCGSCCRSPRLNWFDVFRMKRAGLEDFAYKDNFGKKYIKDKKGWCMFLKKGKVASCRVYDSRPRICRQYPSELVKGSCKPVGLAFDKHIKNKK